LPQGERDISELYVAQRNSRMLNEPDNPAQELPDISPSRKPAAHAKDSKKDLHNIVHAFQIMNDTKECADHISRLAGICLSLNEDTTMEFEQEFSQVVKNPLPWDDEHYYQKTKMKTYTNKDFPEWLPKNDESNRVNIKHRIQEI
jgi:hypothetical protein